MCVCLNKNKDYLLGKISNVYSKSKFYVAYLCIGYFGFISATHFGLLVPVISEYQCHLFRF